MLRLDTEARTFSQEIVSSSQAVMVCKAAPVKVSPSSSYRRETISVFIKIELKSLNLLFL